MNFGIDTLATWSTLLFCMGVYVWVFLLRRVLEKLIKNLATNEYWRGVALVALPPLSGVALGIILSTGFPYPEGLAGWRARALYGLVCGFTSGTVYNIALSIVRKLWPGVPLSGDVSPLPPAGG